MKRDNDDAEYRKIVFLEQSLLYYCLLRDIFYYGNKDITLYLKFNDNIAYGLYHDALVKKDLKSIENWAEYIKKR